MNQQYSYTVAIIGWHSEISARNKAMGVETEDFCTPERQHYTPSFALRHQKYLSEMSHRRGDITPAADNAPYEVVRWTRTGELNGRGAERLVSPVIVHTFTRADIERNGGELPVELPERPHLHQHGPCDGESSELVRDHLDRIPEPVRTHVLERLDAGEKEYGTTLRMDWHQANIAAYQEACDLVSYLTAARDEHGLQLAIAIAEYLADKLTRGAE